ncbi:Tho complex subunit 7-domain-containing protein [Crassisporium funariophilum]|nr:Tho complex subunit 7-domain-containing protein [Crassisporium funariophilum]
MAVASNNLVAQPIVVPPLTTEEEDQIIFARITNDERPLRRVIKKFHSYTSLSHAPIVPLIGPNGSTHPSSVEDAREAYLVELASFQLLMKKSSMICEAEARQVEEYQRERRRLDNEHETLISQIEELKTALEHAQMLRRRKIEYDLVAEKVNTLPSREELEISIHALENDMAAIRTEHGTQNRTIQGHKSALDGIIAELSSLRFMGKERDATVVPESRQDTPSLLDALEVASAESSLTSINTNSSEEEGEESEGDKVMVEATLVVNGAENVIEEEDDIEMGEVEEDPKDKNKKKFREDLEEGEATDASSELSEPPDD